MKYNSFVVPSYNSQEYLAKCLDSLVIGGEDVEIIIVNDGSKDRTLEIAREYEAKYPTIIKVIDKENGGHGSGINAGLKVATGIYYKCVDSDDWVDKDAYFKLLETVKKHYEEGKSPDLYFLNYVYERLDLNLSIPMRDKYIPKGKHFTWKEFKRYGLANYLFLHQMMYKTTIIKEAKMELPEHCFYVDNVFVYIPLFYVKTMYYLDVDFYRYYVGRPNQSVTLENATKNYKMGLRVMNEITNRYTYDELKGLHKNHYKFMIHDIFAKQLLTMFYIYGNNTKEKNVHYKMYLDHFKNTNRKLYYKIKYRTPAVFPFLLIRPLRKRAVIFGYKQVIKKTKWS